MCGMVLTIGSLFQKQEKVFKEMLVVDQLRGVHSTGVFGLEKAEDNGHLIKVLGGPENIWDSKRFQTLMGKSNRVLMGHNRFATQGGVNVNNAHPFDFGDIVGMHNGTLTNYQQLDGYHDYAVDSQVLYNHISNHGLQDAIDNCFGAMALIWWDRDTQMLNMYRNDQRPLFVAYEKDNSVLYAASEWWMISGMCDRNDVKLNDDGIVSVPTNTLFSWEVPKGMQVGKLAKPEARKVERKKFHYQGSPFHQQQYPRLEVNNPPAQTSTPQREKHVLHGKHEQLLKEEIILEYVGPYTIQGTDYFVFVSANPEYDNIEFVAYRNTLMNVVKEVPDVDTLYQAKVAGTMPHEKGGVDYYLVAPYSFRKIVELVPPRVEAEPGEEELDEADSEEDAKTGSQVYKSVTGAWLSKAAWIQEHGSCDCCTGYVDPDSHMLVNSLTNGKPTYICEVCASDVTTLQAYGLTALH